MRVALSNPNFDPTRNPSDVELEHKPDRDIVSLDAPSQEELQYIVGNSTYRDILSDLLASFVDGLSETESLVSADHTVTDSQSQESTNPVVYKLANRQGEGADTSSSQARKKALKRPSEGEPSPSKKRRRVPAEVTRKRKSGTGAPVSPAKKPKVYQQSSCASESEDECIDPFGGCSILLVSGEMRSTSRERSREL